mgnify:CR=1 FL=1
MESRMGINDQCVVETVSLTFHASDALSGFRSSHSWCSAHDCFFPQSMDCPIGTLARFCADGWILGCKTLQPENEVEGTT